MGSIRNAKPHIRFDGRRWLYYASRYSSNYWPWPICVAKTIRELSEQVKQLETIK